MRLNAVVDIVKGELINSPFVSSFEHIRLDPKKVSREDLFIAFDEKEIEKALENGAYGVIFQGRVDPYDNEIAYIRVDDVKASVEALVRYFVASKNIDSYLLDKETFSVGYEIVRDKKVLFIEECDINHLASYRERLDDIEKIFFWDESLKNRILPNAREVEIPTLDIKILKSSAFYLEFIFKEEIYRSEILKYYQQTLLKVLAMFESFGITYKIKNSIKSEVFLKLDGNRYVIFTDNQKLIDSFKEYLPWADVEDLRELDRYETIDFIKSKKFEILISSLHKEELEESILEKNLVQGSLF